MISITPHYAAGRLLPIALTALLTANWPAAHAAAPGITGPAFYLAAQDGHITQPDGQSVYSWGYGCDPRQAPAGFAPAAIAKGFCNPMQIPGPTLVVTQGDTVTVTLTNNLPRAAGNTSILFPDFAVCAGTLDGQGNCTPAGGVAGVLTREAAAGGGTVTYSFVADHAGTHAYYSGTQGDLQIEMGMFGAVIVLPKSVPAVCTANAGSGNGTSNDQAKAANGESDFRLAAAAYNHPQACYDREYLFQLSEMDPRIHRQAEEQVIADRNKPAQCASATGCLNVSSEPYVPAYFLINGRSMPDDLDPNYAVQYPNQPYNANPHMHPGEMTLLRIIGQGRWQHPFHEHANHVRILGRDGNLIVSQSDPTKLAGPLLFTTTSTPGQAMDGLFYYTGKGLNWDMYGHGYSGDNTPCVPDANGYYTADPSAPNYYEWCGDHGKALENNPTGQVAAGGPVTLPDPNTLVNGAWYGGSPYFGPDATVRSVGATPIPPAGTIGNSPTGEAGYAFMWHSHNEREITTDNIFPGGLMTMMLVDPRAFVIDETN